MLLRVAPDLEQQTARVSLRHPPTPNVIWIVGEYVAQLKVHRTVSTSRLILRMEPVKMHLCTQLATPISFQESLTDIGEASVRSSVA